MVEKDKQNDLAALAKQWGITEDQAKDCGLEWRCGGIKDAGKLQFALSRLKTRGGGLETKTWLLRRFGSLRPCCHCQLDSDKRFRSKLNTAELKLKNMGYPEEGLKKLRNIEKCVEKKCKIL